MILFLAQLFVSVAVHTYPVQMQCDFDTFSVVFERDKLNHSNFAFSGEGETITNFFQNRTVTLEDETGIYYLISTTELLLAVDPVNSRATTGKQEAKCFKIAGI
jgi:hypothetical protein